MEHEQGSHQITDPYMFRLRRLAQSTLPGLGIGLPPQYHPSPHQLPPPQHLTSSSSSHHHHHHHHHNHAHHDHHHPFLIVQYPFFTPPDCLGFSCRDNFVELFLFFYFFRLAGYYKSIFCRLIFQKRILRSSTTKLTAADNESTD